MPHETKVIRTETRSLLVKMTWEEVLEKAEQAAKLDQAIEEADEERKRTAKYAKERIDGMQSQRRELSKKVRTKEEFRDVECEIIHDFTEGECRTVRLDSSEIVNRRALEEGERQLHLDAVEDAATTVRGMIEAGRTVADIVEYLETLEPGPLGAALPAARAAELERSNRPSLQDRIAQLRDDAGLTPSSPVEALVLDVACSAPAFIERLADQRLRLTVEDYDELILAEEDIRGGREAVLGQLRHEKERYVVDAKPEEDDEEDVATVVEQLVENNRPVHEIVGHIKTLCAADQLVAVPAAREADLKARNRASLHDWLAGMRDELGLGPADPAEALLLDLPCSVAAFKARLVDRRGQMGADGYARLIAAEKNTDRYRPTMMELIEKERERLTADGA